MFSQIKKAIKELEDILSNNDYKLFKDNENHYKQLFENANISFFETCFICYEINSTQSFCSCDVNFNYGLDFEITKRIELKNYIDVFQNIDKNVSQIQSKKEIYKMCRLTEEEKARVIKESGEIFAPIEFDENDDNHIEKVKSFEGGFRELLKRNPNIKFTKGFIANIANTFGHSKVDEQFEFILKAWNNVSFNKVSLEDANNIYNSEFGTRDISALADIFSKTSNFESKPSEPALEKTKVKETLKQDATKPELVTEKPVQFFKDVFEPVFTYLCFIQFSIVIFIATFFIYHGDCFEVIESEVFKVSLGFVFTGFILVIKGSTKGLKHPFVKFVFSDKSIKYHIFFTIILLSISAYQFLLILIIIFSGVAFIVVTWNFAVKLIDKIKDFYS